ELVLPSGAFTTITPFSVAASKSLLSTPTPARAITFKSCACSITSPVTCVWLRTSSASQSPLSLSTSSFVKSVLFVMLRLSAPFTGCTPSSLTGPLINTLNDIDLPPNSFALKILLELLLHLFLIQLRRLYHLYLVQ